MALSLRHGLARRFHRRRSIDPDGQDALESEGAYSWGDLTTWNAWASWGTGNGADAGAALSFTTEAVDLRVELTFSLR